MASAVENYSEDQIGTVNTYAYAAWKLKLMYMKLVGVFVDHEHN